MRDVDLVRTDQRPDPKVDTLFLVVLRDHVGLFGPSSTWATSLSRTIAPPRSATIRFSNSSAERRSVFASRLICTRLPLVRPTAARKLLRLSAACTSPGERLSAARRSGSIQTRMAIWRPPSKVTRWTPGNVESCGCSVRNSQSVTAGHAPLRGGEAQIERRVGAIGALHLDRRRLGFRRQLGAYLLEPRCDLGQRRRAAVVQLQVHRDGADAGAAGRLDVVDAADRGDDPLDRRTEKAADGFGAGAVVDRRDDHGRAFDLRILLHRQGRQRPPPREHDHEVDDDRQHRVLDEDVGERAHADVLLLSFRLPQRSPTIT